MTYDGERDSMKINPMGMTEVTERDSMEINPIGNMEVRTFSFLVADSGGQDRVSFRY